MNDNVRPIAGPKPVKSLPENDLARGIALMHRLLALVATEPPLLSGDSDHLIHSMRRLGEIADVELGHCDIDGEIEDAIVSLLRWRLDQLRSDAA